VRDSCVRVRFVRVGTVVCESGLCVWGQLCESPGCAGGDSCVRARFVRAGQLCESGLCVWGKLCESQVCACGTVV
jgi:hypothetical protein